MASKESKDMQSKSSDESADESSDEVIFVESSSSVEAGKFQPALSLPLALKPNWQLTSDDNHSSPSPSSGTNSIKLFFTF